MGLVRSFAQPFIFSSWCSVTWSPCYTDQHIYIRVHRFSSVCLHFASWRTAHSLHLFPLALPLFFLQLFAFFWAVFVWLRPLIWLYAACLSSIRRANDDSSLLSFVCCFFCTRSILAVFVFPFHSCL